MSHIPIHYPYVSYPMLCQTHLMLSFSFYSESFGNGSFVAIRYVYWLEKGKKKKQRGVYSIGKNNTTHDKTKAKKKKKNPNKFHKEPKNSIQGRDGGCAKQGES